MKLRLHKNMYLTPHVVAHVTQPLCDVLPFYINHSSVIGRIQCAKFFSKQIPKNYVIFAHIQIDWVFNPSALSDLLSISGLYIT